MRTRIIKYNSIKEFADAGLQGSANFKAETGQAGASRARGDWASTVATSITQAHGLAVNGWPDGASKINRLVNACSTRVMRHKAEVQEYIPSNFGELWDISAYMAGEPDYAFEPIRTEAEVSTNVATVLIGTSYNASVSSDEVLARGGLVLALVEALALSGIELEVWSEAHIRPSFGGDFYHNGVKYDSTSILVCLKRAGDPVDVQSFSFATEAAWLRRLTFGVMEGWDNDIRTAYRVFKNGGYGSTLAVSQHRMLNAQLTLDLGQAIGWPEWYSYDEEGNLERAVRWVDDKLMMLAEGRVAVGVED